MGLLECKKLSNPFMHAKPLKDECQYQKDSLCHELFDFLFNF
jgi:hypothetical protein